MTDAARQALLRLLWPDGARTPLSVWAILDCARDPKVYLSLLSSRLEFRCLYSGRLPRQLEMNAPQLVELTPGASFTARLFDEGWGQAWGVFLKIDDPANLRHHLRKFLRVQDESGRRLVFRYYDPRVLRTYLPTCTADELAQVFGPIASFVAEAASGGAEAVEFARRGAALQATVTPLA